MMKIISVYLWLVCSLAVSWTPCHASGRFPESPPPLGAEAEEKKTAPGPIIPEEDEKAVPGDRAAVWMETYGGLRIGVPADLPPYSYTDENGVWRGIFQDYLALISEKTGIVFDPLPLSSTEIPHMKIWAGHLDGFIFHENAVIPAELEVTSHFFIPIMALVGRIGAPLPKVPGDLAGKECRVMKSFGLHTVIWNQWPKINAPTAKTDALALMDVSDGAAKYCIAPLLGAGHLIRKERLFNLKLAELKEMAPPGVRIAIRREWPEPAEMINRAIADISADDHQRIRSDRIPLTVERHIGLHRTGEWFAMVVFMIAIILFWNRKLSGEIEERKKTEAELLESRQRFKTLYRESPVPTFTWQKKGDDFVAFDFNRAAREFTRGIMPDMLGSTAETFYSHAPEILKDLERCERVRGTLRRQHFYRLKTTGEEKFIDRHYVFIPPDIVMIHTLDLTEQWEAENALEQAVARMRAVFDAVPGTIEVIDRNFIIRDANRKLLERFQIENKADIIGRKCHEVFRGRPSVCPDCSAVSAMKSGKMVTRLSLAEEGGGDVSLKIYSAPIKDPRGNIIGVVECGMDISDLEPRSPEGEVRENPGRESGETGRRPNADLSGLRILVAEDNRVNQIVVRTLLEKRGAGAVVVENGREALDILASAEFDLVLMDIQMPDMDGYEAVAEIRNRGIGLPVIAMTANVTEDERGRCMEIGMSDYLPKPVDPESLYATVSRWMPGSRINGGSEPEGRKNSGRKPSVPLSVSSAAGGEKGASLQTEAAPSADDHDLSVLQGVDTGTGLKRSGGSFSLYARLLNVFLEDQRKFSQKFQEFLDSDDREKAERLAHGLKGASAHLGAKPLAGIAAEAEKQAREGTEAVAPSLVAELAEELERVLASIEEWRRNTGEIRTAPAETNRNDGDTAVRMRLLKELLEEGDSDSGLLIEELEPDITERGFGENARRIEACISRFDFEEALEILDDLMERLDLKEA